MSENKNIGWICPKCGQVNAPSEKTCSCSSKNFSTQPDKKLDEILDTYRIFKGINRIDNSYFNRVPGFDDLLDNTGFPSSIKTPNDSIPAPGYQFIVCPKCGGNIEIPELLCFVGSITFTCKNCGHMITIQDSDSTITF